MLLGLGGVYIRFVRGVRLTPRLSERKPEREEGQGVGGRKKKGRLETGELLGIGWSLRVTCAGCGCVFARGTA